MKDLIKRKLAFPRIANYNCVGRYWACVALDQDFIIQPKQTTHSLETGAKHSPDTICTPFKETLGSFIDALDAGADTLVMSHGLCRLGYYGELHEQILRDLGYEFDFINLAEYLTGKKKDILRLLKRINPKVNYAKFIAHALEGLKMLEYIDEITAQYYRDCGFEEGDVYKNAYRQFLTDMETANSKKDIEQGYRKVKERFNNAIIRKPHNVLRVGIVGEFFTIMDEFSNLHIEQKLADMGVEVHRYMNITNRMLKYPGEERLNVKIHDLCTYEMGPTSTASIWCARDYARRGFDGIIHLKSAGCTPEIDVMPVLTTIGKQEHIPILYLTYDVQTGEAGLQTRLEAFYDMIAMQKGGLAG